MTRSLSFSSSSWMSGEPGRGAPGRVGSSRGSKVIFASPSELQAGRTGGVGEGADAPVVEVPVAVEDDLGDPLRKEELRDRGADLLGGVELRVLADRAAHVGREG